MNRLEERYRRVLRLLPAGYRRQWEDDMVAAFLTGTATGDPDRDEYLADYGRPGAGEVASVVALAARLRFGGAGAPPRRYAWGQALRLAVLLLVLTSAAMSLGAMVAAAWLEGRLGLPVPAQWALPPHAGQPRGVLSELPGWAWVGAYLALVLGHRRAARAFGTLGVLAAVVINILPAAGPVTPGTLLTRIGAIQLSTLLLWLIHLLVVLAMGAFPPHEPLGHRRRWLLALPAATVLVGLPVTLVLSGVPALRGVDWPAILAAFTALGAAGYLVASLTGHPRRTPDRSLALLLLAALAFTYRLLTLPATLDATTAADRPAQLAFVLTTLTALCAVTVPLLRATRRAWHRLPADPAATTPPG